jgi:hypothetical protein
MTCARSKIRKAVAAFAVVSLAAFGLAPFSIASGAEEPRAGTVAREPDGNWVTPFQAYALDGTAVLYTGEYTVERKGGLLREIQFYRDLQGKVVHRVESLYDEINRRPVFYESDDYVNGKAAVARVLANGLDYELRDAQGSVVKSGHYDGNSSTYLWPNLVQLVDAHWDNVITGKSLDLELFFSSLGSSVAVQVAAEGKSTVNGATGEQFKVAPTNGFVKLVMKPIRLVFSSDGTRRLLAFEGRSVLADSNQKNLDLRIVFGPRKAG